MVFRIRINLNYNINPNFRSYIHLSLRNTEISFVGWRIGRGKKINSNNLLRRIRIHNSQIEKSRHHISSQESIDSSITTII